MEREKRECASLTKIMTAYVVIKLMERFKIEETQLVKVSEYAARVNGTSAQLQEADTLTVLQLLYGLMLPSGNDAAHCLAEYFGGLLKKKQEDDAKDSKEDKVVKKPKSAQDKEMNAQSTRSGSGEDCKEKQEMNSREDKSLKSSNNLQEGQSFYNLPNPNPH